MPRESSLLENPTLQIFIEQPESSNWRRLKLLHRLSRNRGPLRHRKISYQTFLPIYSKKNKLLDINLLKIRPTWRNRRIGEDRVAKKLDRFLLREEAAAKIPTFCQWVGEGGISDHMPILLELAKPPKKPEAPFKFNPAWLQEESFNSLFKFTWRPTRASDPEDKAFLFMENLKLKKKKLR